MRKHWYDWDCIMDCCRLCGQQEDDPAHWRPESDPNDRPCNCGSGESWATCHAGTPYCG